MLNKAKKHFGQHFLSNRTILQTMIDAAGISKKDVVLEVGPGLGSLTELLAKHAKRVVAIEKDRDLIPILQEKFKNDKNVEIIEGDALNLPKPLLRKKGKTFNGRYKIVANIPYYITGHFLRLFLENPRLRPSCMVLMVQKEVADRIVAKDKKESLLSMSVKSFGEPKIIRIVPRGAFNPPPGVDSAILKIKDISDGWFKKNNIKPDVFFETMRKAFQNKRKMIKKSLKNVAKIPKTIETKRPEELSLENWASIIQ